MTDEGFVQSDQPAMFTVCTRHECFSGLSKGCLIGMQAQVDKHKVKQVLSTIAGKVDEPKLVAGGLRW